MGRKAARLSVLVGLVLSACHARAVPRAVERAPLAKVACGRTQGALPLGRSIFGSTVRAASQIAPSCARRAAPECVYHFEVPVRSDFRASLLTGNFDGALSLFEAASDTMFGAERACIDDAPSGDTHHARLDLTLEPGGYFLVVDGSGGQRGEFELFSELDVLPSPEEACRAAEILEDGTYQRGSTRGAPDVFSSRCGDGGQGSDQVFALKLARAARLRVRVEAAFAALLSLRGQCDLAASELLCSDDSPSGSPVLHAALSAGDYFLIVDGRARGEGGDFVLAVEQAELPAESSEAEACARAPRLETDGQRYELDTFHAPSTGRGSCGGDEAPDAQFRFSVRESSLITLYAADFEFDAVFWLRRGCDPKNEVLCVPLVRLEGSAPDTGERAVFALNLTPGEYVIGVDGQQPSAMGAGTLRLSAEPMQLLP